MFLFRLTIALVFVFCGILFLLKLYASVEVNQFVVLDWLFIFVYPMVYVGLLFMMMLLAIDFYHLRKGVSQRQLWLIGYDFLLPITSFIIFEQYFGLIATT